MIDAIPVPGVACAVGTILSTPRPKLFSCLKSIVSNVWAVPTIGISCPSSRIIIPNASSGEVEIHLIPVPSLCK